MIKLIWDKENRIKLAIGVVTILVLVFAGYGFCNASSSKNNSSPDTVSQNAASDNKIKKATGKIKETTGKIIGSEELELKGKLQKIGGEVSEAGAEVKDKVIGKVNDVLDSLDEKVKKKDKE